MGRMAHNKRIRVEESTASVGMNPSHVRCDLPGCSNCRMNFNSFATVPTSPLDITGLLSRPLDLTIDSWGEEWSDTDSVDADAPLPSTIQAVPTGPRKPPVPWPQLRIVTNSDNKWLKWGPQSSHPGTALATQHAELQENQPVDEPWLKPLNEMYRGSYPHKFKPALRSDDIPDFWQRMDEMTKVVGAAYARTKVQGEKASKKEATDSSNKKTSESEGEASTSCGNSRLEATTPERRVPELEPKTTPVDKKECPNPLRGIWGASDSDDSEGDQSDDSDDADD